MRDHIYFANTIRSQISEATRAADGSVSLIDADDGAVLVVVGVVRAEGLEGVAGGGGRPWPGSPPPRPTPHGTHLPPPAPRTPSLATFMWPDD